MKKFLTCIIILAILSISLASDRKHKKVNKSKKSINVEEKQTGLHRRFHKNTRTLSHAERERRAGVRLQALMKENKELSRSFDNEELNTMANNIKNKLNEVDFAKTESKSLEFESMMDALKNAYTAIDQSQKTKKMINNYEFFTSLIELKKDYVLAVEEGQNIDQQLKDTASTETAKIDDLEGSKNQNVLLQQSIFTELAQKKGLRLDVEEARKDIVKVALTNYLFPKYCYFRHSLAITQAACPSEHPYHEFGNNCYEKCKTAADRRGYNGNTVFSHILPASCVETCYNSYGDSKLTDVKEAEMGPKNACNQVLNVIYTKWNPKKGLIGNQWACMSWSGFDQTCQHWARMFMPKRASLFAKRTCPGTMTLYMGMCVEAKSQDCHKAGYEYCGLTGCAIGTSTCIKAFTDTAWASVVCAVKITGLVLSGGTAGAGVLAKIGQFFLTYKDQIKEGLEIGATIVEGISGAAEKMFDNLVQIYEIEFDEVPILRNSLIEKSVNRINIRVNEYNVMHHLDENNENQMVQTDKIETSYALDLIYASRATIEKKRQNMAVWSVKYGIPIVAVITNAVGTAYSFKTEEINLFLEAVGDKIAGKKELIEGKLVEIGEKLAKRVGSKAMGLFTKFANFAEKYHKSILGTAGAIQGIYTCYTKITTTYGDAASTSNEHEVEIAACMKTLLEFANTFDPTGITGVLATLVHAPCPSTGDDMDKWIMN